MMKRVYDLAGVISTKVNVYLNNEKVKIKSFAEYTNMYLNESKPKIVETAKNARWYAILKWLICLREVIASISEGQFQ